MIQHYLKPPCTLSNSIVKSYWKNKNYEYDYCLQESYAHKCSMY